MSNPHTSLERDWSSLEVGTIQLPDTGTSRFVYGLTQSPTGDLYMSKGAALLKLSLETGIVTIWAGSETETGHLDGPRRSATLDTPLGVLWYNGLVYFAQSHSIRMVDEENVTTLCGNRSTGFCDGPLKEALFNNPTHIAQHNGTLYVTDSFNHCIRIIHPNGTVSSVGRPPKSSIDGAFLDCGFRYPRGVCVGPSEQLLVVESSGTAVRCLNFTSETVSPLPAADRHTFRFCIHLNYCSTEELVLADTSADTIFLVSPQGHYSRLIAKEDAGPFGTPRIPTSRGSTARPTASVVTPSGDLYWTEELGPLRFIKGMFPSTEENQIDLSALRSSSFSNTTFTHRSSGQEYSICLPLCQLLGLDNLNSIESSSAPAEAIDRFVALIYGSTNFAESKDPLIILCHLLVLLTACRLPPIFTQWFQTKVHSAVAALKPSELLFLASQFHSSDMRSTWVAGVLATHIQTRTEEMQAVLARAEPELVSTAMAFLDISPSSPPTVTTTEGEKKAPIITPSKWIQSRFCSLADTLELSPLNEDPTHNSAPTVGDLESVTDLRIQVPPNFTFVLESSSADSLELRVHDWVLYARWSYFRRMIDAGFDEALNRTASLSKDFPPFLFLAVVKYLYSGTADLRQLSIEECEYIIDNGGEYGMFDLDGKPTPEFRVFIRRALDRLSSLKSEH